MESVWVWSQQPAQRCGPSRPAPRAGKNARSVLPVRSGYHGVHCRGVWSQRGGGIACGDQPAGGADSDGCFEDAADCAGDL